MSQTPLILLSNDDGVGAPGLLALRAALTDVGEVVVCAPETEQSARSHAITLERPLRLRALGGGVFSVDGTPVDAVYVALHSERVLTRRPDVVVAGMNHGLNLGNDLFYSGTVAAAREGALRGIPSIAFSASRDSSPVAACRLAARITAEVLRQASGAPLFNVNFPPGDTWEVVPTTPGRRQYEDLVEFRSDPRGGQYLWIGGSQIFHEGGADTDTHVFDQGKVGVTAVSLELWGKDAHDVAARIAAALVPR